MPQTDTYAEKTLDSCFGDNHSSLYPDTFYAEAFTASPTREGGGTPVEYTDYVRPSIPNDSTNWPDASDLQKSNAVQIDFPTPYDSVYQGVWDADTTYTEGQVVFYSGAFYQVPIGLSPGVGVTPDTWPGAAMELPQIVAVGLMDDDPGGILVCYETLPDPVTVIPGAPLYVGVDGFTMVPPL